MKPAAWEMKNGSYAEDEEDALAPARGCINATLVGTALWVVIGLLVAAVMLLSGCSGGEGAPEVVRQSAPQQAAPPPAQPSTPPLTQPPPVVEPPPAAPAMPVGIWHGITKREGRSVLGVVRPDGELWLMTSVVGAPDWAGGMVHGHMEAKGSTWKMVDGLYINLEHQARAGLTATGTWLEEQRLLGSFQLQYDDPSPKPPLYETDGVDLIYDTRSTQAFDLEAAVGTYHGLFLPLEEVLFDIQADGTIEGLTARGCRFHGTATPAGPIAEGEITFEGPPCLNDRATVRGVLGVDLNAGKVYAAGLSKDQNQGFVFIGQR